MKINLTTIDSETKELTDQAETCLARQTVDLIKLHNQARANNHFRSLYLQAIAVTEGKVTEGKVTEGKVTEGKVTEGKVTEGKVTLRERRHESAQY